VLVGRRRRGVRATPRSCAHLVERGIGYVLAVAKARRITTGTGTHKAASRLPKRSWRRLSAGPGRQRPAAVRLGLDRDHRPRGGRRRGPALAAGLALHPHRRAGVLSRLRTTTDKAGRTGGSRRPPLDGRRSVPVRQGARRPGRTPGPHLDLLAPLDAAGHARSRLLTVMAATGPTRHTNDGLIALTRNEIRRLFSALTQPLRRPVGEILHRLHWSRWRRRHQARAHACHSADRKHNSHDHDLRLEY
jgi:hypothetical protein